MKTVLLVLLFAAALLPARPARASSAQADPFNFLFLDANARPVAMGGAYTALASDANALLYNPGGLGRIMRHQATFMHNEYFQDITQEYLSYVSPDGWGAAFNYLDYGRITRTTISNHTGSGLGRVGATGISVGCGYGWHLSNPMSAGAGVKFIKETLAGVSGQAFALDFGIIYNPPSISAFTLGAALQNLGPRVKFQSDTEHLPHNMRAGAAYIFGFGGLDGSVSFDLKKERTGDVLYCGGLETVFSGVFPVRLGYGTGNDDGPGITAGLGYTLRNFSFDYAFVPFKDLGSTHRFSVTLSWGGNTVTDQRKPASIYWTR